MEASQTHRPVMAGLEIISARTHDSGKIEIAGRGTLTGLATHDDGRKVLVTNYHVMSGITGNYQIRILQDDEEMYQGDSSASYKIGTDVEALDLDRDGNNLGDVAYCELVDNVATSYRIHEHPTHGDKKIVAGTEEPQKKEWLYVARKSGLRRMQVKDVRMSLSSGGFDFTGMALLSGALPRGDSGSAVLRKVTNNTYKMVGIVFSTNIKGGTTGVMPASVSERELNISFGNSPPVAVASASPQHAVPDQKVRLDSIGSYDPQRDEITYRWQQISGPTAKITGSSQPVAHVVVPATESKENIRFRLTLTDSYDEQGTAEVLVNRKPIANPGMNRDAFVGDEVELDGSGSKDLDGDRIVYRWFQQGGPTVSLDDVTAMKPKFTPTERGVHTFWLTVTDEHGGKHTKAVRITVKEKPITEIWGEWASTGSERADPDDSLKIQREEQRTSNLGNTDTRWVFDRDAPEVWGPWSRTGNYQECGSGRQAEESRTSNYGNTDTRWVSDPEDDPWSDWEDTGDYSGCGPNRQKKQERSTTCGITQTRWAAAAEPDPWGNWSYTNQYQGCGPNRQRKQTRTSKCGRTGSRWVASPTAEIWGSWTDTGNYQGCGPNRQKEQEQTSDCGNRDTQWVASPVAEVWGDWEDTGSTQGCGAEREKEQERTSDCGSAETQWVTDPEEDTWGDWVATDDYTSCGPNRQRKQTRTSKCGRTQDRWTFSPEPYEWSEWGTSADVRGCGPNRERKEVRSSQCGTTQTRWVADPVAEVWGIWKDTDQTRNNPCERERKQERTSDCGNTEYQWVSDPEPETWGSWTDTGDRRISPGNELIRQRKEERTSNCGNTETRWVYHEPLDQSPVWSVWEDTGKTRGATPCVQEKEQQRTSDQGETQTRWVDDARPETWGSWSDTGNTRGAGLGRQKEQKRTSNCGNTETRWLAYPDEEWPDDWQDTGRYRGSLGSREREQERYSNLGNRQTRWISDPDPETWGNWTDTGEYRENPDTFITEYEQSRTSNYGNVEYRWSE